MDRSPRLRMDYVRQLRALRKRRGFTQMQLADASGVDQKAISDIESGARHPSVPVLLRLVDALGGEMADLFPKTKGATKG